MKIYDLIEHFDQDIWTGEQFDKEQWFYWTIWWRWMNMLTLENIWMKNYELNIREHFDKELYKIAMVLKKIWMKSYELDSRHRVMLK